jgi:hypothetical protein
VGHECARFRGEGAMGRLVSITSSILMALKKNYAFDDRRSIFIRDEAILSSVWIYYIRTITAMVQLKIKSPVVSLKGLDTMTK